MAIVSTHILNSLEGTHAAGVAIDLYRVEASGERVKLVTTTTDEGGRMSTAVQLTHAQCQGQYELVVQSGAYFCARPAAPFAQSAMQEVVIRFAMPAAEAKYHMPLMLAPHSYSVWCSNLAASEQDN